MPGLPELLQSFKDGHHGKQNQTVRERHLGCKWEDQEREQARWMIPSGQTQLTRGGQELGLPESEGSTSRAGGRAAPISPLMLLGAALVQHPRWICILNHKHPARQVLLFPSSHCTRRCGSTRGSFNHWGGIIRGDKGNSAPIHSTITRHHWSTSVTGAGYKQSLTFH